MTRLTFEEIGITELNDADRQHLLATLAQGLKCDKCGPRDRFKMPKRRAQMTIEPASTEASLREGLGHSEIDDAHAQHTYWVEPPFSGFTNPEKRLEAILSLCLADTRMEIQ